MSSEIELKFRVPPSKLSFLGNARIAGSSAGRSSRQELVSTYFDTASADDHEAIVLARQFVDGRAVEVWEEARRVALLEPE